MASGKITNKNTRNGSIKLSGSITSKGVLNASITSGGGTTDHRRLTNRATADQHPIEAITDLRKTLDSKLDIATALPLINEVLKGKAKGLYFDAKKELAKKSYWYLTAEIDPVTKQGTKESIISGPYDFGTSSGSANSIVNIEINANGELLAMYADGTTILVGKVQQDCACPGIYMPSKEGDKLIFTLQDTTTEERIEIDIDPTNEWNTLDKQGETNYVWNVL